jgi:hypothetical protein
MYSGPSSFSRKKGKTFTICKWSADICHLIFNKGHMHHFDAEAGGFLISKKICRLMMF